MHAPYSVGRRNAPTTRKTGTGARRHAYCVPGLAEARDDMVIDFTAQTAPLLSVLIAALFIVALVLFACLEPELAEVYLGDWQLLVATVALVAFVIAVASGHAEATRELGFVASAG